MQYNIGDRITLKKIDKRFKTPDLRVWKVVGVKHCKYRNENRYDLIEDKYGCDKRFDYPESELTKRYKIVEE